MSDDVLNHFRSYSRAPSGDSLAMKLRDELTTYQFCKSVAGRAVAGLLVFAFSPLIVVCGVLVRLTSKGPSFYSQVRLGHHGRKFRIYKLRTMQYQCESSTGAVWASARDPRVTPLGRVLRRLHLDELPQLWNIFCGDMCFIGPRPERPEIAEKLQLDIPNFNDRLSIRQGLTGLSQVLQEADVSIDSARRKLRFDLDYGRRESLWLDFRIVVGTAMIIIGVPRPTVDRMLSLNVKRVPTALVAANESIFESPRDLPNIWDSGILGSRDSGILGTR